MIQKCFGFLELQIGVSLTEGIDNKRLFLGFAMMVGWCYFRVCFPSDLEVKIVILEKMPKYFTEEFDNKNNFRTFSTMVGKAFVSVLLSCLFSFRFLEVKIVILGKKKQLNIHYPL